MRELWKSRVLHNKRVQGKIVTLLMELSRVKTSFFFILISLRLRASKSYKAMTLASRPASSTGAACCCWGETNKPDVRCTLEVFPCRAHQWCAVPRAPRRGKPWLGFRCGCRLTVVILQDTAPEAPIRDLADWKVLTWPTAHAHSIKSIVCSRLLFLVGRVI